MTHDMTHESSILLRYHEIALKGRNRSWFENKLAENARTLLKREFGNDFPVKVQYYFGRVVLRTEWTPKTKSTLARVFGLASFSPMTKVETNKDTLVRSAIDEVEKWITANSLGTFRVSTRRSDKVFPETSMDLDSFFGAQIRNRFPHLQVNLKNPDLTLGIEIRKNHSFIWTEKIPSLGGLPVGSNAPVLSLISGGVDSPVAAIQILGRGSSTGFVHFHGTPFVGEEVLDKVRALVKIVNQYQPVPQPLHVIPFGLIQEKIALTTPPRMRTLLYRRMMVRIATRLARSLRAQALITGESLGQVASQTLENLSTINSVAELPILRPLIAFNKEDIIALANRWGTFKTSVQQGLDCCTLFADRNPILRSTPEMIHREEERFSVPELVEEALAGVQVYRD